MTDSDRYRLAAIAALDYLATLDYPAKQASPEIVEEARNKALDRLRERCAELPAPNVLRKRARI